MTVSNTHPLLQQLKTTTRPAAVLELLEQLSGIPLDKASFIQAYHEQLLFLRAFPASKKVYAAAGEGLARIAAAVQNASPTLYAHLCGDGIAHTELICSYSLSLTEWLSNTFSASVSLHSSGADYETVRKTLQLVCPNAEFEKVTQGNRSLGKRITILTGLREGREQLRWLLQAFAGSDISRGVQEELFRQLQVYVQWKTEAPMYSRTFLQYGKGSQFYHKSANTPNIQQLLRQKINTPEILTHRDKTALCKTIKTSLALLCRETDPVTFADEKKVQLFNMGRGFKIALLYMKPEKTLSLDCYIGYMAFKNGVPVSYGGGWIFGHRCKIGVNIYPAFRKGESKWIFCQVLRLYHQYFNITCFTVNPYQFGKANTEGLKSGAFWFYYRLGFRPVNTFINTLAQSEWDKISSREQYRSPESVLKKFTACPVSLELSEKMIPTYDAAELSCLISRLINLYAGCNRNKALSAGHRILQGHYGISTKNETLILLCLLSDNKRLPAKSEMKKIAHLWRLKEKGAEREFITGLQHCKGFWKLADAALADHPAQPALS